MYEGDFIGSQIENFHPLVGFKKFFRNARQFVVAEVHELEFFEPIKNQIFKEKNFIQTQVDFEQIFQGLEETFVEIRETIVGEVELLEADQLVEQARLNFLDDVVAQI